MGKALKIDGRRNNGGKREGVGRKPGSPDKRFLTREHVNIQWLSQQYNERTVLTCAELAFGTTNPDPKVPGDPKKMAKNEGVRFACLAWLADRGNGRAPHELRVEHRQTINAKFTTEYINGLTLEQLGAFWKEQVAIPAGFESESGITTPGTSLLPS